MSKKILVVYASKCGATAEIAQAVGRVWREQGATVEVRPAGEAGSLEGCAAVVVGSAVRFGQWLPDAVSFVKGQQAALAGLPVVYFTVHALNTGSDEASQKAREAYSAPARGIVAPRHEAFFTGAIDLARLSFAERLMAKAVKSPIGDLRDWAAIESWAKEVYAELG